MKDWIILTNCYRRMTERETIPNHKNWRQELYVINRSVKIRNYITEADESRYDDILPLAKVDDMFTVGQDMILNLGRGQEELNMVVLIPKTESRSAEKVSETECCWTHLKSLILFRR